MPTGELIFHALGRNGARRSETHYEVNDANTASVVSGILGIPIASLTAGKKHVAGKDIMVNQTQLDRQVPNIQELVQKIE